MNSSLQCLSAAVPLTDFLLSDKYKSEINEDNPLGTKGELTNAFAALLGEMWSKDTSIAEPRSFKFKLEQYANQTISCFICGDGLTMIVFVSFAPQFSGYQQHDSQELLAFLLDGLHEDLNRVKKKPYVESVESDGKGEEEVAKVAWEGHKVRKCSSPRPSFLYLSSFHGRNEMTLWLLITSKVNLSHVWFALIAREFRLLSTLLCICLCPCPWRTLVRSESPSSGEKEVATLFAMELLLTRQLVQFWIWRRPSLQWPI